MLPWGWREELWGWRRMLRGRSSGLARGCCEGGACGKPSAFRAGPPRGRGGGGGGTARRGGGTGTGAGAARQGGDRDGDSDTCRRGGTERREMAMPGWQVTRRQVARFPRCPPEPLPWL